MHAGAWGEALPCAVRWGLRGGGLAAAVLALRQEIQRVSLSHPPSPPKTMGNAGRLYVVGMLVYSVFRAIVVSETLTDYGVNPAIFLVLDVGSALPLAWGQVRLLQALRGRNPRGVQHAALLVTCAFLAPYLYLVFGAGRPLPVAAYVIIGVLVAFMLGSTLWRIRTEARASALLHGAPTAAVPRPSDDETTAP